MKTENTPENKAKFFALYYGQKLLFAKHEYDPSARYIIDATKDLTHGIWGIELTPIHLISDDDCKEIASLYGWDEIKQKDPKRYAERIFQFKIDFPSICDHDHMGRHRICVFDYLRSKGYALPWMNLSVEDMIGYGWIKLKKKDK